MKKMRLISFVLVLFMLFSILPTQALAEGIGIDIQNEQLLKEELRKAADEKQYPNGLFEFLSTRMNTSEDLSYVEFAIVRKGGTAGKASVTFKAVDVTAKYGSDYTISVPKGLFTQTLPENTDAKPLIESFENVETSVSDSVYSVSQATYSEPSIEYQQLQALNSTAVKSGLREARDAYTGTESERKTWREVDQETKETALNMHNEVYEGVPGVTYTFNFADGEYIKKLRFNTINDTISEDEEQVMFALLNPVGGVLGEAVSGFMNIQDNEAKEKVEFELIEDQITADRDTGYAEVTVRRTAGFYRYGMIQVGTAALTAQPDVDYTPISEELRFVPGQETQKVKVPLLKGGNNEEVQFLIKLDPSSPNLSTSGQVNTVVIIEAKPRNLIRSTPESAGLLSAASLTAVPNQITVMLKSLAEDPDASVIPRIWTSAATSTEETAQFVGSIAFAEDDSATSKTFNTYGDYINLVPKFADNSLDKSKVYLWGYKIERIGGLTGDKYYYVDADYIDLWSLSVNQWQDVNDKYIPFKEILMKNNTIVVLPVYRERNAFVKIKYDESKGELAPNSFSNGEIIRVGMLDTVRIRATAKAGYRVSGFQHGHAGIISNYGIPYFVKVVVPSNSEERRLARTRLEFINDSYRDYGRILPPIDGININPAFPGELDFKPHKNLSQLIVQYSESKLKLMVDPTSSDQDKGSIAYFPSEGLPLSGNSTNPMVISSIERNKAYTISGSPDEGYRMLWKDWSGDIDEDGIIDEIETENMEKYEHLFDRKSVSGNFYNYVANYDAPLIYYSFEPKPMNTTPGTILGRVYLSGGNVLDNTNSHTAESSLKPIPDVSIMVNGHSITTDKDGKFLLKHTDFTTNEYHTIVVNYKGSNYTGYVNVNNFTKIIIEEYDAFVPYNFAAYDGSSQVDLDKIDNRDANFKFRFDVKAVKPGITAEKALIRIYSKENVQRGTPIEVLSDNSTFIFNLNPATYNVVAGDRITIQLVDQNQIEYTEHNVGFNFKNYLSTFSLLTSFKSPAKPAVDLVGAVDAAFDLGLAGQADKYMEKGKKEWTIRFGFKNDWEKSLADGSDVQDKKPADEALKDAAKSTDESEAGEEKAKNTVDKAIDKNQGEKKSASITSDVKFGISTSLYLKMTVNEDKTSPKYGYAYFNEMILSVTLTGSYHKRVERMTPIGVTVYIDMVLGGEITGMMVIEQYDYKKFYFNDKGEIDFSKAGTSDPNRDFTIYGKLLVKPHLHITAGGKIAGADLSISGNADFDMDFTTSGSSSGKVTLTSEIKLEALFFTYKWKIAQKSWSLFSNGVNSSSLLGDGNYLYDSAENYEVMSRKYLEDRGNWQDSGGNLLLGSSAYGTAAANEKILQTGVYPNPYTLLATIGENQQLLVFLDDAITSDAKNRTQLFYSIYNGTSWSVPQPVDNDNTPDGLPWISDIGDKVLVAWSSSVSVIDSDDTVMSSLNNRNIKARFFNKAAKTFGAVQEVTHETEQDQYSDSEPYIAYWKDETGKEDLMITYTKSEYRATGSVSDQDAVVGDIINPYYSTLAYRFYNFSTNTWDVSSDKADGYYGQGFISVTDYVYANDADFVISGDQNWNGYWSRLPYSSEVGIRQLPGNDPLIADSNLSDYKDYAVLAYELDLDTNLGTTADRELFIQLYNYKDKVFYSPIRCTSDAAGEYDLEFVTVNDKLYLYYISNGDIMAMDIGKLIDEGLLRYDIEGKQVLLVNKLTGVYSKPETVVRHRYDTRTDALGNEVIENERPIDEFMVKADNNNVYIVWGEKDITYKDGIDPNSKEAALPENHFREHHIYAARQTIGAETSLWSYPVKLTEGTGANYRDLDFEILPDGSLRTVFVKTFSEVMDVAGMRMSVVNTNNSILMTTDFDVNKNMAEVTIGKLPMPKPSENLPVTIKVQNMGLKALNGAVVEVYETSGETTRKIDEQTIDLRGGETRNINLTWQAPQNPADTKLQAYIKLGDETLDSDEQSIIAKSVINILDAYTILAGRNKLRIVGTAVNNGNIGADSAIIIAEAAGVNMGTVDIGSLSVGDTRMFDLYVDILPGMFKSTVNEDGSVSEVMEPTVHSESGTGKNLRVERSASKQDIDAINNISTFELIRGGNTIPANTIMYIGSKMNIKPYLTYKDETLSKPRIVYVSSDEEIADFSQGYMTLLGKKSGRVTITAYALPQINEMILSKNRFVRVDNMTNLAEAGVKVKSFVVDVISEDSDDGSAISTNGQAEQINAVVSSEGDLIRITTTVKAQTDSSGKAAAAVTDQQISAAISKALEETGKQEQKGNAVVEIKVEAPMDANKVETGISVTALKEALNSRIEELTISTPGANLTFNNKTLSAMISQASENVKIAVSKVNTSALSDEIRQSVGERPVYDFSVTSGDRVISEFNGNVTVALPYTPGGNEDINAIVVYYIDEEGKLNVVSNCVYNPKSGMVTFNTNHFSRYAVGYNKVNFKDVPDDAWYADAVDFIAARGITTGTGEGNYSPVSEISRGQFIVMLMRSFGIEPDKNPSDNFIDAGSDYYTGYLSKAKSLGISKGTGDNRYLPDKSISRQEMFTLLYNTLKVIDKLPEGGEGKNLESFSDGNQIEPWAKDAVTLLVNAGIINGSDGKLNLTANLDRAQMAQVIYNLITKQGN